MSAAGFDANPMRSVVIRATVLAVALLVGCGSGGGVPDVEPTSDVEPTPVVEPTREPEPTPVLTPDCELTPEPEPGPTPELIGCGQLISRGIRGGCIEWRGSSRGWGVLLEAFRFGDEHANLKGAGVAHDVYMGPCDCTSCPTVSIQTD